MPVIIGLLNNGFITMPGKQEKFRKTRKVFISHSHTKNISKNIIGSIYFSYLYLDRKHIFVVFMTMFRFIVPKLI